MGDSRTGVGAHVDRGEVLHPAQGSGGLPVRDEF